MVTDDSASRAARRNLAAGSVGRPRERRIRAAAEPACAGARRRGRADRQRPAAADRNAGDRRHRKPRDQGALDRSGSVRSAAGAAAPRARRRCRRRSGRCMRWCSICRRLTTERAAGAGAARGVRRSVAGRRWRCGRSSDGVSFSARGAGAGAGASSARRSTICRPGRPRAGITRAFACSSTAARWRRCRDSALFAGANAAAVQRADGAWEVMQFANAELVGESTYLLSRLLRGQAGSEWAMARAACGRRAVRAARRAMW